MRVLLSILICFFITNSVDAKINFSTSYKKALKQAKEQNKLIFIDFTASWCGPCQRMEKDVFSDPQVSEFYNANFVNLKLDEKFSRSIMLKYGVSAFPTLMFLTPDKSILVQESGSMSSGTFIRFAQSVNALYNFKERYYSAENESASKQNLIEILQKAIKQMPSRYFKSFLNHTYHYLPDHREVIFSEFSSQIVIDEKIEKSIKESGNGISNNRMLRDKMAVKYFTAKQFPKLSDIAEVKDKLKEFKFNNIHESGIYLSSMYAYELDVFSSAITQKNQRIVFGKDLLLNYPYVHDKELLLSVLYYLIDQEIELSYYESLITKFSSNSEPWTYLMHDIYAVALVKTGNQEEAVNHIQLANEMAVQNGFKYVPAISRMKLEKQIKP